MRRLEDDDIRALVARLARPHPSGGRVIERAAIFAEGADFDAVMAWILQHDGTPEAGVKPKPARGGGLHGSRFHDTGGSEPSVPSRFILPAGALD